MTHRKQQVDQFSNKIKLRRSAMTDLWSSLFCILIFLPIVVKTSLQNVEEYSV